MAQPTPQEQAKAIGDLFNALAENASHIANSKRRLFEAYVSEGFTESQSIELIKGSGI